MNAEGIQSYINDVKEQLGESWIEESKNHGVVAKNIGGIAYEFSIDCFMNDVSVDECVAQLKNKFPEEKK